MGRLTTHVLDTASGKPAAGVTVEVYRVENPTEPVAVATTNAEGRVDAPLLEGEALTAGVYEMRFHAGDYLRGSLGLAEPPFLDIVPIRFGVTSPGESYHIPLILSPHGYSTYRGS